MREIAVSFGESGALFGILSLPNTAEITRPLVLIPNNGLDHRTGPGRMHVELARALAEAGMPSFRLDRGGLGDSEVVQGRAAEDYAPELRAAMDALDARGLAHGYVVIGCGSGAHDAHQAARVDPRIVATAFLDGYTYRTSRYWLKRTLGKLDNSNPAGAAAAEPIMTIATGTTGDALHDLPAHSIRHYVTPSQKQVAVDLLEFIDRQLSMLFIFTGQIESEYSYPTQLFDAFPFLRAYRKLTLHHLPNADHRFERRATREVMVGLLTSWALGVPGRVGD